jgi:glycosyltransferase involved in cell wall biosynthesis
MYKIKMKILLVGEYSRLHTSLKEGLTSLGHQVTVVSSGDGLKKFKTDINYNSKIKATFIFNKINNLCIRYLKIDFIKIENAYRIKKILPDLKDFDIVQLINEDALFIEPKTQIQILGRLISQNKKLFLLCCGDDYITTSYYLNNKNKYSILTPYLKDKSLKNLFVFSLKYITKPYIALHQFVKKNSIGTIATDLDYHIPMLSHKHYLGLIPNPINIDKISFSPLVIDDKINIFLGINTQSQIKKGISFFEDALSIIQKKYPEKVTIKITKDLPYNDYIKTYNEAHILMDQVYGFDQGYNALEAMSKGKVVFTGAELEWLTFYNLKEDSVAINALPNVSYIVEKLEWLILNPENITKISKNARNFIEQEHNYIVSAKKYIKVWAS